jgi:hypothetical protein
MVQNGTGWYRMVQKKKIPPLLVESSGGDRGRSPGAEQKEYIT